MRFVAVTTLLLASLALLPAAPAVNECQNPCQTVVVPKTAPATNGATYYLYPKSAICTPPAQGECAGQPGAVAFGFLYEEANCTPGLQRYPGFPVDCSRQADKLVLL